MCPREKVVCEARPMDIPGWDQAVAAALRRGVEAWLDPEGAGGGLFAGVGGAGLGEGVGEEGTEDGVMSPREWGEEPGD